MNLTVPHVLTVVFVAGALLNAATAVLAWRHRTRTPAARALSAAAASLAVWAAVCAPQNLPLPQGLHDGLTYASFATILGAVVSLHLLARFVVDPHLRLSRAHVAHLVAVPAAVLLAVATDPLHHLVFTRIVPLGHAPWYDDRFGPLFWVHTAWCYLLLTDAAVRLARAWLTGSAVLRPQAGGLLLASTFPLAGNVAVLCGAHVLSGQDLTPLFFTLTGLLDAWVVLRLGLLRTVPVARAAVLETIDDHVVVIDAEGTVVDVNASGRAFLAARRPDLPADPVGVAASQFLTHRALADLTRGPLDYVLEYTPGYHVSVKVTALTDRRGRALGRVLVARDITDLVETRRRLEELQARLSEEAVRDPLTGLHNRRHLDPAAAQLLRLASPDGPVGVLVVDVDHFKSVNDRYGHAVGDEVLVAVAHALRAAAREGDLVARTGGEEFVLVLPGARPGTLARRAEDVRAACAAVRVRTPADTVRRTVSVGTASVTDPGTGLADVLARADAALYEAKESGRDRVVHSRDAQPADRG
ncbi:histidine kinase N-terminal 7TM domain-containing diguanylate cyclase [Kineococcus rhizosphaerae]|uniref:Diguanylate cyclase (GGDEF)-like protein n=1 Tax=Kineococcus rhizosphaerae TaxID=559628 RepID=A0A2T0R3B6_9ACTN|nr:diguanylate cyclase [Kineococcus rhizosphaerae]PRY14558.1 diguanylate cyclase (GGDEF)-like protein [Kineococcus rhizosphaerae]